VFTAEIQNPGDIDAVGRWEAIGFWRPVSLFNRCERQGGGLALLGFHNVGELA
jgi:hypothetical protein